MTITKRIVIETENGEITGVYTNVKDLEARILDRDDVMIPVDEQMAQGDFEVEDKVDVSFDPDTVEAVFEHTES